MRTRSFNSSRRALTLASSSAAGTTTLNSRLRPSDSVSVTCIAHTSLLSHSRRVGLTAANRAGRVGIKLSALGVVRAEGLEPPRLSPLEPKSSASTNSATPAKGSLKDDPAAAIRQRLARNGLTHRRPPGQAVKTGLSGGGLYHGKTARHH